MIKLISNSILISIFIIITSCGNPFGKAKKVDLRKIPVNSQDRAKQNVEEGRGVSLKNLRRVVFRFFGDSFVYVEAKFLGRHV